MVLLMWINVAVMLSRGKQGLITDYQTVDKYIYPNFMLSVSLHGCFVFFSSCVVL